MTGRNQGFTLLEVLLAMSVLGVVVAMLSLSLSASLKVVEGTEREEDAYFQAQTAMRRIGGDLVAAFTAQEGTFVGEKKDLNGQRADSLQCSTLAHLVLNPEKQQPGAAVVRYWLQPDAADARKLQLLRSDTPALPGWDQRPEGGMEPAFLLADNLRSVQFSYFDREGQEFDSWQKGVDVDVDKNAAAPPLPAAVHVILEFWIDPDQETAQTFSTRFLLPAEGKGAN